MGKSRAEIQKAYRERKKAQEGSGYLRKETERVKRYYKPTTEITPKKLSARRKKVRDCMRRKRNRQPANEQVEEQNVVTFPALPVDHSPGPCDSTTASIDMHTATASTSSGCTGNLVVKMKFAEKRGKWKKSKSLKKANHMIKTLSTRVSSLRKRNETLRKKLQRSKSEKVRSPGEKLISETKEKTPIQTPNRKRKHDEISTLTPHSRSKEELRNEGLSPSKHRRLIKKLTFHHTLIEGVKETIKHDRGRSRQRSTLQIVCGKVLKKYRMKSRCSEELNVHRNQVLMSEKRRAIQKGRKVLERRQAVDSVVKFLEREDNSACLPGKRDATRNKNGSTQTQTRVLNDYLYNLHLKYRSENPDMKLSLTTFASYRPKYIKLVKYCSRRTCLCQRHQNIALKLKGLKAIGAVSTDNPDAIVRQSSDEEIMQRINACDAESIKFAQWKRKEVVHKGKTTKRMMIENVQMTKLEFMNMFRNDLVDFRQHTERVKCQYEQIKLLKENLPGSHVICQMDFAENYSCGHAEEIQTAYFDKCSVTLHPVVIYAKGADDTMVHTSYIYVSDTLSHNSGTVYAFLKRITDEVKSHHANIECIHYISDSPTSQYRNKAMMYVVANHDSLFGFKASWQYWEAGHGKGPCDGVGGTSKRLADLAVKRQTHTIQSARDYYQWGASQLHSQTKYCFVPKEECDDAYVELSSMNIKPIKGTLDIHSVVFVEHGVIAVRNTSCFCDKCFVNGDFKASCERWTKHIVMNKIDNACDRNVEVDNSDVTEITSNDTEQSDAPTSGDANNVQSEDIVPVNSYVAAVYNGHWYLGKVMSYDPSDENLPYQVSFMQHGKGKGCHTFKWPDKEDTIWRERADILCVVNEPICHGTRKMFKLQESDINVICEAFDRYK